MNITINESMYRRIAMVESGGEVLATAGDFLDLLGNASYQGASGVVISERDIAPEFFDLRTGIAGEILQKFSNYQMKLAIVGEFGKFNSKALNAFIIECNRGNHVFFVGTNEEALERLDPS